MTIDPRDVEELLALWLEHEPDPVDLFEDELARRLGVEHHPGLGLEEWRRVRVETVERADGED